MAAGGGCNISTIICLSAEAVEFWSYYFGPCTAEGDISASAICHLWK